MTKFITRFLGSAIYHGLAIIGGLAIYAAIETGIKRIKDEALA